MKNILLSLSILLIFSSCDRFLEFGGEELVDYELVGEPKLVVEAYLNDSMTYQTVKLSFSGSLDNSDPIDIVENAIVSVTEEGNPVPYEYEYVDSLGLYAALYAGKDGLTYTLNISHEGKQYTATETMLNLEAFRVNTNLEVSVFDINHWRFFDPEAPFFDLEDQPIILTYDSTRTVEDTIVGNIAITHNIVYINPETGEYLADYLYGDLAEFWFGGQPYVINSIEQGDTINIYKVTVNATENQAEDNYYRFDIQRFGRSWLQPGNIIVADDNTISENLDGIDFPGFFVEGDVVDFYMYGISRTAYIFYSDFLNVLNNDGGGFTPPPGNPVTNVFDEEGNPILGIFEVANVAHRRIIVNDSIVVDN